MNGHTQIDGARGAAGRRRIVILGSTGSIGRQTLDVIGWHLDRFEVVGLAAHNDSPRFREQVCQFRPTRAALTGDGCTDASWAPPGTRLLRGERSLVDLVTSPDVDLVVVATSGTAGLAPTVAALERGCAVALANKEVLIMAGHLVMAASRRYGAPVIPVDSEHSAIWQCLIGEPKARLRRLILTASGGAFRDLPSDQLAYVTPSQALKHPNWSMGPKITIDSATMMNKGLEVLEACWLFGVGVDDVSIVLHRESIVHSLVEFVDGSLKAQLSMPDMRLPIQFALSYPDRLPAPSQPLDLGKLGCLTFSDIERDRYRCVYLALDAGRHGHTYPTVMNAANEVAVELFLAGLLRFDRIGDIVEETLNRHVPSRDPALDEVYAADAWARQIAHRVAPLGTPV
ncbi:MAG: 1-deoxy-D-xylulose-5-phosphate reductoisomerase [Chloroflexi bacterium]|nr:1-deoxy-D-xylulose-5-phosphate reductoisomerase [Chloroflexota bacterium]